MGNEKTDEKPNYKKTEEELRRIAMDVVGGSVFTDRHCPNAEDIRHVFMMISLGGRETLDLLTSFDKITVYEYLNNAGPRSVNDLPCFLSFQLIVNEDVDRFWELVVELDKFLKPPQPDADCAPESETSP